jgi:hypothetical protein
MGRLLPLTAQWTTWAHRTCIQEMAGRPRPHIEDVRRTSHANWRAATRPDLVAVREVRPRLVCTTMPVRHYGYPALANGRAAARLTSAERAACAAAIHCCAPPSPVFCSHQCPLVGVSARMKSRLGETSPMWGTTARAARLPPEATGVAPTIALFLLGGTSPRGLPAPFSGGVRAGEGGAGGARGRDWGG